MDEASHERLTEVIRLKKHIFQLKIRGNISLAQYNQLNSELDVLSFGFVDEIELSQTAEFIGQMAQRYPEVHISILQQTFAKQRLDWIRILRSKMVADTRHQIDLSSIYPQSTPIPLYEFSWQEVISHAHHLVRDSLADRLSYEQLLTHTARIFGEFNQQAYLADLKFLQKDIFRKLIIGGWINKEEVAQFQQDEDSIRNLLVDRQRLLRNSNLLQSYSAAEQLTRLKEITAASEIDTALIETVIHWSGPELYVLLNNLQKAHTDQHRIAGLILARTGIHPPSEQDTWRRWCNREQLRHQTEMNQLEAAFQHNRLLFDILHLVSFCPELATGNAIQQRWLSVAEKLSANKVKVIAQPVTILKPALVTPPSEETELDQKSTEIEPSHLDFDLDDIDNLTAPTAKVSLEDTIVRQNSSWNHYIKPFLSENWLGLIGIGFIIAAWPILSMLVWNLGEYYRLAAGALPLLFITLGSAWITEFFTRLNNPNWRTNNVLPALNRKPVLLFSCLTLWSLPFNVIMAVTMLSSGNLLIGGLMLLIYAATMYFIGPKLGATLGRKSVAYLILSHCLILIPSIVQWLSPASLALGLALMTYAAFFILAGKLHKAITLPTHFGLIFASLFYGGHLFLLLAPTHIFFQQLPSLGTATVLLELLALGLLYQRYPTPAVPQGILPVISGSLSLFGLVLGLAAPSYLPLLIIISAFVWHSLYNARTKAGYAASWIVEVFAAHPIALFLSLSALINFSSLEILILACTTVITLWAIESLLTKCELKILSWLLPPSLMYTAFGLEAVTWENVCYLALCTFGAVWYYARANRLYHSTYWFIALFTLFAIPALGLQSSVFGDLLNFTSYATTICLGWAIAGHKTPGGLAKNHATSMSWLLCSAAILSLLLVINSMEFRWEPQLYYALLGIATASLLTARRSQSALPTYCGMALLGGAVLLLQKQFHISMSSGLGSVMGAGVLIYLAPKLQQTAFFQCNAEPDRFFNKPFWFISKRYFQAPLEQGAWLLLVLSMLKATMAFAPATTAIKVFITYMLLSATILVLAMRYKYTWLAALSLMPFTLALVSCELAFPAQWQPLTGVTLLYGMFCFHQYLQKTKLFSSVMHEPLRVYVTILSYLFIPAGFIAYIYAVLHSASPPLILVFGILCLFYIQQVFMGLQQYRFAHLSIMHICCLWTLSYFLFISKSVLNQFNLNEIYPLLSNYILGLFLLLFAIAYLMEWFRNDCLMAYRKQAQPWLILLAVATLITNIFALALQNFVAELGTNTLVLAGCLLSLHLANRYFHYMVLYICKWLACLIIIYNLNSDVLISCVLGTYLLAFTEALWHSLNRFSLLRLQGLEDCVTTPTRTINYTLVISISVAVVAHSLHIVGLLPSTMSPLWLYLLLPITGVAYHFLSWPLLAFGLASIFIYANIFTALLWSSWAQQYQLTQIHLINTALLLSAFVFLLINYLTPVKSSRSTGPEQHTLDGKMDLHHG